ncbi:MAG: PIN domain-containing protein [Candidatus Heimdallarchaeota archaeon]
MKKRGTLILLDTNFLLAISQNPVLNISHELDRVIPQKRTLIVLEPILSELRKIKEHGSPKVRLDTRMALEFVNRYCEIWATDHIHRNIDFILLSTAQDLQAIIATNDHHLKTLAKEKGIKILYVRNRRWLELR